MTKTFAKLANRLSTFIVWYSCFAFHTKLYWHLDLLNIDAYIYAQWDSHKTTWIEHTIFWAFRRVFWMNFTELPCLSFWATSFVRNNWLNLRISSLKTHLCKGHSLELSSSLSAIFENVCARFNFDYPYGRNAKKKEVKVVCYVCNKWGNCQWWMAAIQCFSNCWPFSFRMDLRMWWVESYLLCCLDCRRLLFSHYFEFFGPYPW